MTNYERIKNMSIDEMAEWLDETLLDHACCANGDDMHCEECDCLSGRKKWLESIEGSKLRLESEVNDDKN